MNELINILSEQIILNINQGLGYNADRQYLKTELTKFTEAIEKEFKTKYSRPANPIEPIDNGISIERVFEIQRDSGYPDIRGLEDIDPEG